MMHYILKDGDIIPEPDLLTWARWFENTEGRRVAETTIGDVDVSTVFLGLDHSFGGEVPVLFETMIFGGEYDDYCERYTTLEAAMLGHERAVALVQPAGEA